MAKENSEALFRLIKSLRKSEKRYFKIFTSREGNGEDKKFIRLFDLIDKQAEFDEAKILSKDLSIRPEQFSNLKAHLYKRILQSIRLYNSTTVKDIEIRELIDYAQILFNRSLYDQCVKVLQRAKKLATKNDNLELLLEIFKWEKNVISQTVGKDNQKRVNNIINHVKEVNSRINNINIFSNLSVKLNSLYLKTGFIRNKEDYDRITTLFRNGMPEYDEDNLSITEKLNLYNLYVGYCFFIQDFENGYYYAKKWVNLFNQFPELIPSKLDEYIRSLNRLMVAQYKLMKYHEFVENHKKLKAIRTNPKWELNDNIRLKLLKYTYVHEFNKYFMLGDFSKGVLLMNRIKPGLEEFIEKLDNHSRIILYYKIACLYFGKEDYREAIKWLNKIIHSGEADLREDVHCFARILNLISHYELGNTDIIDYCLKSTYLFFLKKDDLHIYQKYILKFLKNLNRNLTEKDLIDRFESLRKRLLPLVDSAYEKRMFIYFDIISWLESKIQKRPVQEVIREKADLIINADLAV